MSALTLALLPVAVILTACISGVFGMGGGLILMGVYAWVLPVPAAMVLHGVTQFVSNGSRALLLRRNVVWGVLGRYVIGAALSVGLFAAWTIVVDRTTLFLVLGTLPICVSIVPARWVPSIETPSGAVGWGAVTCGAVVTAAHLVAGVSGPLLDAFFLRTTLTRHQIVGTKALTQTLAHTLKVVYFGVLLGDDDAWTAVPWWLFPVVTACAVVGTWCGRRLLDRLDDNRFRRWSTALLVVLCLVFLVRGLA